MKIQLGNGPLEIQMSTTEISGIRRYNDSTTSYSSFPPETIFRLTEKASSGANPRDPTRLELELMKAVVENSKDMVILPQRDLAAASSDGAIPKLIRFYSGYGIKHSRSELLRCAQNMSDDEVRKAWLGDNSTLIVVHLMAFYGGPEVCDALRLLVRRAIELGISPDTGDKDGDTLLHLAACNPLGGPRIIRALKKCNVEARNAKGVTPIFHAVLFNERLECMKALLERNANTVFSVETCERPCCANSPLTPLLMMSIRRNTEKCLSHLLESGLGERLSSAHMEAALDSSSEIQQILASYFVFVAELRSEKRSRRRASEPTTKKKGNGKRQR